MILRTTVSASVNSKTDADIIDLLMALQKENYSVSDIVKASLRIGAMYPGTLNSLLMNPNIKLEALKTNNSTLNSDVSTKKNKVIEDETPLFNIEDNSQTIVNPKGKRKLNKEVVDENIIVK